MAGLVTADNATGSRSLSCCLDWRSFNLGLILAIGGRKLRTGHVAWAVPAAFAVCSGTKLPNSRLRARLSPRAAFADCCFTEGREDVIGLFRWCKFVSKSVP